MKIFVDIDGTLCRYPEEAYVEGPRSHDAPIPIQENIDRVNKLYDQGHEITIHTSRGMRYTTPEGEIWGGTCSQEKRELILRQLAEWEVQYDHLWLEKPYYDVWVDDKAMNEIEFAEGKKLPEGAF